MQNKQVHFVDRDGFRLKIIEQRQGLNLLIIGSADYYQRTMPEMIYNHFRCIFIDHRGFAECNRDVTHDDASLEKISSDTEAILQNLGVETSWVLGHSGHAYMALDFCHRYPNKMLGCAIVGAAPSLSEEMQTLQMEHWQNNASPNRKSVFEKNFPQLEQDIKQEPKRKFANLCYRLGAMRWFDASYDERPLWHEVKMQTQILDILWGEVFSSVEIGQYAQSLQIPILILGGEHDYSIAPISSWSKIEPSFKNAQIKTIAHCGHTPMLEQPEAFTHSMIEFVSSHT